MELRTRRLVPTREDRRVFLGIFLFIFPHQWGWWGATKYNTKSGSKIVSPKKNVWDQGILQLYTIQK